MNVGEATEIVVQEIVKRKPFLRGSNDRSSLSF